MASQLGTGIALRIRSMKKCVFSGRSLQSGEQPTAQEALQCGSLATPGTPPPKAGYFEFQFCSVTKCYFEAAPVVRRPPGHISARISVSSLEYGSTRGIAKGLPGRQALRLFVACPVASRS